MKIDFLKLSVTPDISQHKTNKEKTEPAKVEAEMGQYYKTYRPYMISEGVSLGTVYTSVMQVR